MNADRTFSRRLERVGARLTELELSGLLVSHLPNIRYLTGFSGTNGWLLLGADEAVLLTDGRYEERAAEELDSEAGIELLVVRNGGWAEVARQAGRRFSGGRVGFEEAHVSYGNWGKLNGAEPPVQWIAITGLVERQRAVKDEAELVALERAAFCAATAMLETLPLVAPGILEREVAAELEYRMRRAGAEGPAFETIVASGARTALPHAQTSDRAIREGDLLLIDFGARWHGYSADLTRTFVVGRPQARQEEVYRTVLAAQGAARAALRPGATGAEVDAAARALFAELELDERFLHSTGHGIGLEVHEGPGLRRRSEDRLAAGMVVTLEPGLYFSDWGGIRIEDDFVVTEREPRPLAALAAERLQPLPL